MPFLRQYGFELVSFVYWYSDARHPAYDYHIVHGDIHLIHVLQGSAYANIRGESYLLTPDCVFFSAPHEPQRFSLRKGVALEMLNIHCQLTHGHQESVTRQQRLPRVFHPNPIAPIHRTLRDAYAAHGSQSQSDLLTVAELHRLVAGYFATFAKPASENEVVDSAMWQLRQTLEKPDMVTYSAPALAASIFLSVSQMNRRFRRAFGCSPKDHWQQIRLSRVVAALQNDDARMYEIAEAYGFQNPYYFSTWFRRLVGQSPKAFRQAAARQQF